MKEIRKLGIRKHMALLAALLVALAVSVVPARAAVAKELTLNAGEKGQLELPQKFSLSADRILAAAKARADYVRVNGFVYGDAYYNPAFDERDRKVSCDRFVQWVLHDLGYNDLPGLIGLVCYSSDPNHDLPTWCANHGFKRIKKSGNLKAGDIVFLGTGYPAHVYIIADNMGNGLWLRYDAGGQDLINAVQPIPAYIDNPAKGLNFLFAYRMVTPEVGWSSSDENVATISADGVATAVGQGTCKVTAQSTIAKKVYTITVNPTSDEPAKPERIALSRKISKKSKTFTVSTTRVIGADGFQIQYSRKKSMKDASTKNVKVAQRAYRVVVKTKKSKTRYYVRVRAYKNLDGEKLYGDWSDKAYIKSR